jgi:hypothetical protein
MILGDVYILNLVYNAIYLNIIFTKFNFRIISVHGADLSLYSVAYTQHINERNTNNHTFISYINELLRKFSMKLVMTTEHSILGQINNTFLISNSEHRSTIDTKC